MKKDPFKQWIDGYKKFHEHFFEEDGTLYGELANGQAPKTLIIACSDSRVDPAIISSSLPGDLFVIRNVANLVPEYEDGGGRHGVSAAIEFAVVNLQVEQVIILGHRECGGIKALLFPEETRAGGFVQAWMKIAEPAKQKSIDMIGFDDKEELYHHCEKSSIQNSLKNLRTFPFVKEAEEEQKLKLLGMYFDFVQGELYLLDELKGEFSAV